MKVAIIGQGYVGLTISAFAGEFFEIVGFDNNQKIVDQLNKGISHIEGVESSQLAKLVKAGNYSASTVGSDIEDADLVVIAVPTPLTKARQPDLSFIEAACKTIGESMKKPVLVINESTSFPGTLRNYIKPATKSIQTDQLSTCMRYHPNVSIQAEVITTRRTPRASSQG
jgi:UDP-N-acetyl-D-glucosamine dehydrogenase